MTKPAATPEATMTLLHQPSDAEVAAVFRRHLDPQTGSRFWVERDRQLGRNAYQEVCDLASADRLFGFRNEVDQQGFEEAARRRPIENFVPRDLGTEREQLWVSQTGGTTGLPKHGTWGADYWRFSLQFTDLFLDLHGVPRDENWLFIGPMGPHTTGRLAVDIAERRGGACFSIDLDPRIVKVFGEEGMTQAYDRYIEHIWSQVNAIIESQDFGVLFCTSRLLEQLPSRTDVNRLRGRLRGIIHAGTTMPPESHQLLREEIFPDTPIVGMYGTSTTGISYQKPFEPEDDYRVIYIPTAPQLLLDVVAEDGTPKPFGEDGQVRVWRLSRDQLLPGFYERDRATRVEPYGAAADLFPWPWIGDPYSPEFTVLGHVEGVY